MKLLTATRERQGERDGDFCFAVEGELVLVGYAGPSDQADPDGGCGCLPVGAVVGRRLDHLVWRSEPSEIGDQ